MQKNEAKELTDLQLEQVAAGWEKLFKGMFGAGLTKPLPGDGPSPSPSPSPKNHSSRRTGSSRSRTRRA
jgi:hypothetical protein